MEESRTIHSNTFLQNYGRFKKEKAIKQSNIREDNGSVSAAFNISGKIVVFKLVKMSGLMFTFSALSIMLLFQI